MSWSTIDHIDFDLFYGTGLLIKISSDDYFNGLVDTAEQVHVQLHPISIVPLVQRPSDFPLGGRVVVHRRGDYLYFVGGPSPVMVYHKLHLADARVRFELCKMKVLGSFPVLLQHLL